MTERRRRESAHSLGLSPDAWWVEVQWVRSWLAGEENELMEMRQSGTSRFNSFIGDVSHTQCGLESYESAAASAETLQLVNRKTETAEHWLSYFGLNHMIDCCFPVEALHRWEHEMFPFIMRGFLAHVDLPPPPLLPPLPSPLLLISSCPAHLQFFLILSSSSCSKWKRIEAELPQTQILSQIW